jgi:hypothetical protein
MLFRYLRKKKQAHKVKLHPGSLTAKWLSNDSSLPVTLRMLNSLSKSAKKRIYRLLLPPSLLVLFDIDPISWKARGDYRLTLKADCHMSEVNISISTNDRPHEEFFCLQLMDNNLNGIDLNFLIVNDPYSSRFNIDSDIQGHATLFGTASRNHKEEENAIAAGLAPGQVRKGLSFASKVLQQVESFITACGHSAYRLEPLTYSTACMFERYGFAYICGHKLLDTIHKEFQPGNRLYNALDGSTPFRQSKQYSSIRGRSWAIHDGILNVIDKQWNHLRMIKRIGHHTGVDTSPGIKY